MMEKTLKPDEFPLNDRYATAYKRVISTIIYRLERCDTKLLVEISRFGMIQVISAVVYSLETPNIYKDLNYFTRNISFGPTLLQFSQSPLYKDYPSTTRLFCDLYSMEWKSTTTVEKTLYRGVSLPFQGEVGDTLSLMQFTSASTDRDVALNFLLQLPANSSTKNKRTIQEFIGGHLSGIDMQHISDCAAEQEVLLFPYQTFTIVDIVEETINSLSGEPLTLQTFKLCSELVTAMDIFGKVSRHFPPSSLLFANDENLNVESIDEKIFQLSGKQLKYFKNFQLSKPETSLALKETLPEYHILGTCTLITQIQTYPPVEITILDVSVVHVVLNIAVLEKAISSNCPVYLWQTFKYNTATETNHALAGPTNTIRLVPRADVLEILRVCKQKSENSAEKTKPTTYVISNGQHFIAEEAKQIEELFPPEDRSRAVIRHVASKHFTARFLRDNVLVIVMQANCTPFTFNFTLPFNELQKKVRMYNWFVFFYLVFITLMSLVVPDEWFNLFYYLLILIALYSVYWIKNHVAPNNIPQN